MPPCTLFTRHAGSQLTSSNSISKQWQHTHAHTQRERPNRKSSLSVGRFGWLGLESVDSVGWSLPCNKLKLQTVKVELDAKVFVDLTSQNSSNDNVTSSPIADFSKLICHIPLTRVKHYFLKSQQVCWCAEEGETIARFCIIWAPLFKCFNFIAFKFRLNGYIF